MITLYVIATCSKIICASEKIASNNAEGRAYFRNGFLNLSNYRPTDQRVLRPHIGLFSVPHPLKHATNFHKYLINFVASK